MWVTQTSDKLCKYQIKSCIIYGIYLYTVCLDTERTYSKLRTQSLIRAIKDKREFIPTRRCFRCFYKKKKKKLGLIILICWSVELTINTTNITSSYRTLIGYNYTPKHSSLLPRNVPKVLYFF